jgi:hypothetical protein
MTDKRTRAPTFRYFLITDIRGGSGVLFRARIPGWAPFRWDDTTRDWIPLDDPDYLYYKHSIEGDPTMDEITESESDRIRGLSAAGGSG